MVERVISSLPESLSRLFCSSTTGFAAEFARTRNDIGHLKATSSEIAEVIKVVRKARCLLHILLLQRVGVPDEIIARNLVRTYGDAHSP
jgi:hypothetical protein